MKAVFVSFNQAHYDTIFLIMDRNNIRGFTYWEEVQGRGSKNGEPHYGNHAWPGMNAALLVIMEENKVDPFLSLLRELDTQTEALGLRAFVWNIEKTI